MNREEALEIWTPEGSPWSRWVKAVLFVFMADEISDAPTSARNEWHVPFMKEAALMVELPGAEGVETGVALARSGYRPIPLYNTCPYPVGAARLAVPAAIDVVSIMHALERATGTLEHIPLPPDAPPAFLLDANRQWPVSAMRIRTFDNRSIVRESDLPTAAFLKAQGIEQVIVIQSSPELQRDLRAVLLSWQEAGLRLLKQAPAEPWNPRSFALAKPSLIGGWWDKIVLYLLYGLYREGPFGAFMHGSGG